MDKVVSRRCVSLLFLFLPFSGMTQESGEIDFLTFKPEFTIARIDTDQAPVIDGDLSDPAWQLATRIDDFYQKEPVTGGTPSEDTVVYIAYDEDNLYVGVYAYMDNTDNLVATIMQRDNDVWKDNNVRVILDPYNSDRDGLSFVVNPLGAQQDRLIENNARYVNEWDTIHDVEARIVEDGWIAEIEIPFRSIPYDPNNDTWGFDILRSIRHKNETVRLSSLNQSLDVRNVSMLGDLKGIRDTNQGMGLDVQGFAKMRISRDRTVTPKDDDIELEPAGNIYYKITPALTGTLTFNTDFSDTPLDERQVNTGRFGLFFPETRDFMLQDQAVFEFGGSAIQPGGFGGTPNGLPFFSRRIGIVGNQIADIQLGGKVSGRVGDYNVGLLSAYMSEENNLDSQVLSVARVSKDFSERSRMGTILTHGDPRGIDTNTVFGFDYQFQDQDIFGTGQRFVADFYYQQSISEAVNSPGGGQSDDSFGLYIGYPNDVHNWFVSAKEIGEHFAPALGFVNRRNIRDYAAEYRFRVRPSNSWLRWWQIEPAAEFTTDLDNTIQDQALNLQFMMQTQIGDEFRVKFDNIRERINEPFRIAGKLLVPADYYRFNEFQVQVQSSNARNWRVGGGVTCCEVFDGDFLGLEAFVEIRPIKYLSATFEYEREHFDLPTGELTVHVASLESSVNFSPDMVIDTQIQYDNISETLSYFSRFRWFPRPETEIFAGIGHTAIIESDDFPGRFISQGTSFVVRFGHTFRF